MEERRVIFSPQVKARMDKSGPFTNQIIGDVCRFIENDWGNVGRNTALLNNETAGSCGPVFPEWQQFCRPVIRKYMLFGCYPHVHPYRETIWIFNSRAGIHKDRTPVIVMLPSEYGNWYRSLSDICPAEEAQEV